MLDQAALLFETAPKVSIWYPPAGLSVVLMLIFGLRYAPLLLVTPWVRVWFVGPDRGQSIASLLTYSVMTMLGSWGIAAVLLWVLRIDPGLRHLRDVAWFVGIATAIGPLIIAALTVANATWAGTVPWAEAATRTLHFWAGDATGIGFLGPVLLIAFRALPGAWAYPESAAATVTRARRWPTRRGIADGLISGTLLVVGVLAAYGAPRGGELDYTYVVFVPLIWIAVRHGFEPSACAVLAINVGAALLAWDQIRAGSELALQFGLMAVTLTGLLLGAFMSERRMVAEQLRHQALHDPLTGLGNRTFFLARVQRALADLRRRDGSVTVLFLDLDDFKAINDSLGHTVGDQLLVAVGERLDARVPRADSIARLGGDEFALLVEGFQYSSVATTTAERVVEALREPFRVDGKELFVSPSIGNGVTADGRASPDALLRDADVAMYAAKERGRQLRTWRDWYPELAPLTVAVNLSAKQLQNPRLVEEVAEALRASGLPPGRLVLEITESAVMQQIETTLLKLHDLNSLGVQIAVDDFGTGYSSLGYLHGFPIDVLKVDKTFVDGIAADPALAQVIIQLGCTLHLTTVAEGVETLEQVERLRTLGCEQAQDYYFAEPLTAAQIEPLLAARAPLARLDDVGAGRPPSEGRDGGRSRATERR